MRGHATLAARVRRGVRAAGAALLLAATLGAGDDRRADGADVPVEVQVPLFLKALSFDRRLAERAGPELVVGVAYQRGDRASRTTHDEVLRVLAREGPTVDGRRVRVLSIDLDREPLAGALAARRVTLLYVAPLRGIDVAVLASATRAAQVTTATGVPRYVLQGLAVGTRLQGERPRLLINVEAARREGADFRAELLKLAQVVH